jgi:hypothetical protein
LKTLQLLAAYLSYGPCCQLRVLSSTSLFLTRFPSNMALLSPLLLSVLYLVPLISATCYYPDGTIETSTDYMPCVATVGTFSMCCATNRAHYPDQCLPNGLCHNPCATSGNCGDSAGGQYWRESCTDPSWSSPYCLKNVCANPAVSILSLNPNHT